MVVMVLVLVEDVSTVEFRPTTTAFSFPTTLPTIPVDALDEFFFLFFILATVAPCPRRRLRRFSNFFVFIELEIGKESCCIQSTLLGRG